MNATRFNRLKTALLVTKTDWKIYDRCTVICRIASGEKAYKGAYSNII
ncbi:hypothetical protein SAMN04488524_0594 [Pedobacter africanus]|uniref:Uncharacterized protein n=1 Tax=Pedobacter africanus TaxID=151894 RepID=A0A1W1ZCB5_9SPHI|nr:hypothetical protein SAMN04488524_0594 [Pedobacter africanus]